LKKNRKEEETDLEEF